MMKKINWKVTCRGAYVDSGTVLAEGEREALDAVLAREVGTFKVKPEESYAVTAGGLCASAYGDEFERVREASYLDDTALADGGRHLYAPPKVAGLPCSHPSMNRDVWIRDVWIDGEKHAACDSCDFVDPNPVMRDTDREREDRVLDGVIKVVGQRVVRSIIQEALEKVVGAVPIQGKRCADPADHRVVAHHMDEYNYTRYYCRICDGAHIISDAEHVLSRVPIDDWEIRRRLSQ